MKNLLKDSTWLLDGRGKADQRFTGAFAGGIARLVCLAGLFSAERDLDEVLDSQERMLVRRKQEY